ncbi:hypothetical protein PROFUN_02235 [Planoprotostelium fungivorum]|uniref:Uncharacterized protein n=1 Tax=Planoprotostelium fungivorum TaxID=1890364 RepID=A0A2P6NYC6_9EUKA|nr:hypothetical protein PROFUN_02235 [Planoprotostelium fungivorum]
MSDKATKVVTPKYTQYLSNALAACGSQSLRYGTCVTTKMEGVERGSCQAEWEDFKRCWTQACNNASFPLRTFLLYDGDRDSLQLRVVGFRFLDFPVEYIPQSRRVQQTSTSGGERHQTVPFNKGKCCLLHINSGMQLFLIQLTSPEALHIQLSQQREPVLRLFLGDLNSDGVKIIGRTDGIHITVDQIGHVIKSDIALFHGKGDKEMGRVRLSCKFFCVGLSKLPKMDPEPQRNVSFQRETTPPVTPPKPPSEEFHARSSSCRCYACNPTAAAQYLAQQIAHNKAAINNKRADPKLSILENQIECDRRLYKHLEEERKKLELQLSRLGSRNSPKKKSEDSRRKIKMHTTSLNNSPKQSPMSHKIKKQQSTPERSSRWVEPGNMENSIGRRFRPMERELEMQDLSSIHSPEATAKRRINIGDYEDNYTGNTNGEIRLQPPSIIIDDSRSYPPQKSISSVPLDRGTLLDELVEELLPMIESRQRVDSPHRLVIEQEDEHRRMQEQKKLILERIKESRSLMQNRGEAFEVIGKGLPLEGSMEELKEGHLEMSSPPKSQNTPLSAGRQSTRRSPRQSKPVSRPDEIDPVQDDMISRIMEAIGDKMEKVVQDKTKDIESKIIDLQKLMVENRRASPVKTPPRKALNGKEDLSGEYSSVEGSGEEESDEDSEEESEEENEEESEEESEEENEEESEEESGDESEEGIEEEIGEDEVEEEMGDDYFEEIEEEEDYDDY